MIKYMSLALTLLSVPHWTGCQMVPVLFPQQQPQQNAYPTCPSGFSTYIAPGSSWPQICFSEGISTGISKCPSGYQCMQSQNVPKCCVCCCANAPAVPSAQSSLICAYNVPNAGVCTSGVTQCPTGYGCDSRGVCCPQRGP